MKQLVKPNQHNYTQLTHVTILCGDLQLHKNTKESHQIKILYEKITSIFLQGF